MRYNDKKLFILYNEPMLQMLRLRQLGLSMQSLALLFGLDWSTIRYHCQKLDLPKPQESIDLIGIIRQTLPQRPKKVYRLDGHFVEYYPHS